MPVQPPAPEQPPITLPNADGLAVRGEVDPVPVASPASGETPLQPPSASHDGHALVEGAALSDIKRTQGVGV